MKMFNLSKQNGHFALKFINVYAPDKPVEFESKYGWLFIQVIDSDADDIKIMYFEPCTLEHGIFKETKGAYELS